METSWRERDYARKATNRNGQKKREMSEEEKKRRNEIHKKMYRTINMKFHVENEKEIIDWLDSQDCLKKYLRELLKEEKEKNSKNILQN